MKFILKTVVLFFVLQLTLSAIERVSVDDEKVLIANDHAVYPVISRDGRFVAFISKASNLAQNDTNNADDIFVHDRQNGTIERVVIPGVDNLHIADNSKISMSNDGRYIVFVSLSGLLAIDTNEKYDVYLIDRSDQSLTLVSMRKADGLIGNGHSTEASISGDGSNIVFNSTSTLLLNTETTSHGNIFLYDLSYGEVVWNVTNTDNTTGNGGNGGCRYPHITNDGRYIVFQSHASDLVAGDTNGKRDFFIRGTHHGDPVIRIDARRNTYSSTPSDSSISDDGRYVVFDSSLDDLVADDTNGVTDVFIYDKNDGSISRLNVGGIQGTLAKFNSSISGNGNYITYLSGATVAERKVYRYNRATDTAEVISLNSAGENLNDENRKAKMSFDANLTVFSTRADNVTPFDTNSKLDIVVRNQNNNSTDIISGHTPRSNDSSSDLSSVSKDGRYVAFSSKASNLIADDTNGVKDVFVRDTKNNTIERVSVATDGTQGEYDALNPSISADGRYVSFETKSYLTSHYSDIINIFVHDRQTHTTVIASDSSNHSQNTQHSQNSAISSNGRYVVFKTKGALVSADDNNKSDIYLRDLNTRDTELISVASDNVTANGVNTAPSISSDGRYIAFESYATNFTSPATVTNRANIFIRDRQNSTTTLISQGFNGTDADGNSKVPSISDDGKFIVFQSTATNLLSSDDTNGLTDIFLYNRAQNNITLISKTSDGTQTNDHSYLAYTKSINKDGRYIVFRSGATNLVSNDTNARYDAFLYDTDSETTIRLSKNNSDEQGNSTTYSPSISSNGNVASFYSLSSNLVEGDNNNKGDIFTNSNPFYKGNSTSSALIMYLLN